MLVRTVVCFALVAATLAAGSHLRVVQSKPYDVDVIPRASAARIGSLGHAVSAANLYWLKAVQYIGEPRANERGWEKLFPLVELVTDLDPGHGYAYQVAGVILGSVDRVAESNAILEKGIRNAPNRYILPFLRAFNAFYYKNDFGLAGRYVEIAADVPGSPAHLRDTALAFYVKGQEADAAIAFLERMLSEAADSETAAAIERQLKQARLEKAAQAIDDAVERYRAEYGVYPPVLELLRVTGFLEAIPEDPFGGSFVFGEDGRVRSSANPFRYKKPDAIDRRVEPGVTPETGYPGVVH